jgi:hypothetical protein
MIVKLISCGPSTIAAVASQIAEKLGLDHNARSSGRGPSATPGTSVESAVDSAHGSLYVADGAQATLRLETVKKAALRLNKPILILDRTRESGFAASRRIAAWIADNRISALHVDGDDPADPAVAAAFKDILEATFFLSMMEADISSPLKPVLPRQAPSSTAPPPETVAAALDQLEHSLSLKDRATIANMSPDELVSLNYSLGDTINTRFDLFTSNTALLDDCRRWSGQVDLSAQHAAAVIVRALWERLRATCRIRIVK